MHKTAILRAVVQSSKTWEPCTTARAQIHQRGRQPNRRRLLTTGATASPRPDSHAGLLIHGGAPAKAQTGVGTVGRELQFEFPLKALSRFGGFGLKAGRRKTYTLIQF